MGNRGVAAVVDLAQARARRAKTGAQIGRGQARRANPAVRAPRAVLAVDWDAYKLLDRADIDAIQAGTRPAPVRIKKFRRTGIKIAHRRLPLERAARRLAWKTERRITRVKVAWPESQAAQGRLAPVIPIGTRSLHGRLRSPLAGVGSAGDLMDEGVA